MKHSQLFNALIDTISSSRFIFKHLLGPKYMNDIMSHALLKDTKSFELQQIEWYFNRYNIDLTSTNLYEHGFAHEAVYNKDLKVSEYFIEKGVPINHQAKDGSTPLHRAVHLNSLKAVSTLLEHKASIDIKTKAGHTPLDIKPIFPEIEPLLTSYQSNINQEVKPIGEIPKIDYNSNDPDYVN